MFGLKGFAYNVSNVYRASARYVEHPSEVETTADLRPAYHSFIRDVFKQPDLQAPAGFTVSDGARAKNLLKAIGASRLNDLDQEGMVGESFDSEALFECNGQLERAIDLFKSLAPRHYELFKLVIHSIVLNKSRQNRAGQRAHAGSSNGLIGLIWLAPERDIPTTEFIELLVHELTHTLVFIDELSNPMFNYNTLVHAPFWAKSAILKRARPMDKVVHSIAVSTEILDARVKFLGHPQTPVVHSTTAALKDDLKDSINSVLSHPRLQEVCLPGAIAITEAARIHLKNL